MGWISRGNGSPMPTSGIGFQGGATVSVSTNDAKSGDYIPANLWAVSSGNAASATINQLRQAFHNSLILN